MGWVDALSARAAHSSSCSFEMPLSAAGQISCTSKIPLVNVPVLSKTMQVTCDMASRKLEPFTRTPARLAPPMLAKKLKGILTTSAQGQLMTRKVRAR